MIKVESRTMGSMTCHVVVGLVLGSMLSSVHAFSVREFSGSSKTFACSTLIPGHAGIDRQPPTPAFTLTAHYSPSENIVTVVVAGSRSFKGFIIQAQDVAGSFLDNADSYDVGCSQATVRHVNSAPKNRHVASFRPTHSGILTIRGSVVENYSSFYELDPVTVTV